jgi:hypothetical protein
MTVTISFVSPSELEFYGISDDIDISLLVLFDRIKFPALPEHRLLDEGPERITEPGDIPAFFVKDVEQ